MTLKDLFSSHDWLDVFIQGETGKPVSFRLETRQVLLLTLSLTGILLLLLSGSLLFLREVETNRQLSDALLSLRTKQSLDALLPQTSTKEEAVAVLPKSIPAPETAPALPLKPVNVAPKLTELDASCVSGTCTAHVGLVPASTGLSKGSLLVVLEAEVVRIGASVPGEVQKRFLLPTGETRDAIGESDLTSLPKKTFRFSRDLKTNVSFTVDKWLKPTAIHLYLFNANNTLIHQEQKPVSGVKSDDP